MCLIIKHHFYPKQSVESQKLKYILTQQSPSLRFKPFTSNVMLSELFFEFTKFQGGGSYQERTWDENFRGGATFAKGGESESFGKNVSKLQVISQQFQNFRGVQLKP